MTELTRIHDVAARLELALGREMRTLGDYRSGPTELYEAPVGDGTVQMLWLVQDRRAGFFTVGSSYHEESKWTDAKSPADALQRYLSGNMTD